MVAYEKSYEKQIPCGGWIPWRVCTKTYYKEEYHAITVPESMNVTDCCEGYEQVGLYCSLPLNRSSEFASTLGACPQELEELNVSCTIDKDCPERQKCCETSKGMGCSEPVPEEQTVTKYWYKVSVLVKMDFKELVRMDPRLQEHSRLLHSMTAQAEPYTETLTSQVLISLQQLVPLVNLSSLLKDIVMRVYEVIDIDVQVLDSPNILFKTNSTSALVINSTCASQKPGRSIDSECYPSSIKEHRIFNVTHHSFEVSWNVEPLLNHTFQVEVYKGKMLIQGMETTNMTMDVFELEAGRMYTVKISYEACDKNIVSHRNVKTDALIFGITVRILNYNFTEQLLNTSTKEYQEFFSILLTEIEKSFPTNMFELYKMGKLKVQMDSIKTGSIIVKLKVVIEDPQFPKNLSAFDPMLSSLHKSSVLHVDPRSSIVEDWDECTQMAENDCCVFAECINTIGSYMCRCRTTTDVNPSRPGRNCEGEIVDPVTERIHESKELPVTSAGSLYKQEIWTSKHHEAVALPIVLPSSDTQESNTSTTDQMEPASQSVSTSRSISNNNTLSFSETPPQVAEQWASMTIPTTQAQHGSSLSIFPTVSNSTPYAHENGSLGKANMSDLLPEGITWEVPTSAPYVTEQPMLLNQTVHEKMGTGNISSSENKSHSLSASSDEQLPSSTTAASSPTNCNVLLPVERIFFPNVTSTGFHIVWTTNYVPNPSFLFLLFDGEKLIQEVKTQNCTLIVSGLEPGVLYTVKIKAEVCEKNSKPAWQTIRTAAQKFSGTVRITNLNYSSEFTNSSSEEYQNFTQLFFTEVRNHLPLYIVQQMDTGTIKLLITSISNGSIVVNFDLLVATDMDADNVSRSFFDAFQQSPCFKIDNSSLSIHDYDECDREETDCSPNASCKIPIKDAVRVICDIEKVVITIWKLFLQQEAIPESSLYLGEPHCNVSTRNSSHVTLRTGWNECGTEVNSNTTHTIVKTVLRNDMPSLGIIHHFKIVSPVHCVFQNDLLTSSGYTPEGVYTIFQDLHGSGHFLTEMQLFIGNSPIPENFSISASDDIMIEVGIQKKDSRLKVVVSECWATPTNNSRDLISFPFIHGSCPVSKTHTAITANGISSKAQFKLKIFSFVNNSVVYLHCKIHICVENLGSTCKTNCKGVRSWRTGETIPMPPASWGPLRRSSEDSNEEKKSGLGVGYIVLIVIGVFVLALGIAGLLVFRFQQKAGAYNFQIKSDNFSYQVFYQ
uniref:Uncharacterized protein n=1 Tax=Sphaerodactylus townsendi TaxID=933632 RepID=A0ACB8FHZ8_9SAUR